MDRAERTPVAITVNQDGSIVVACDDGTVWTSHDGTSWKRHVAPIPGSTADQKDERERRAVLDDVHDSLRAPGVLPPEDEE